MKNAPFSNEQQRSELKTTPAERPLPTLLNAFLWDLWPFMAWLFPVALFGILLAADAGGWEQLILLVASPVLLPAYALLNLIPRRIIRKSDDLPNGSTGLTCLLILHWWGLAAFALFFRGTGDSGGLKSFVGEWLWWPSPAQETTICLLGGAVSMLSWIWLLAHPSFPARQTPRKPQWLWPLLAFVVPPLAVALALTAVYTTSLDGAPDAAGISETQALRTSTEEARAAQSARWDALQKELVPLRTGIAADAWVAERDMYLHNGFVSSSGLGLGFFLESFRTSMPGYTLEIIWETQIDEPFADARVRVSELANRQGWEADGSKQLTRLDEQEQESVYGEEFMFIDGLQNRFRVLVKVPRDEDGTLLENGTSVVTVRARSAEYWREGGFDSEWEGAATPAELEELAGVAFASNAWPELRLFQAS